MSSLYHPVLYDRDAPIGSYWEASAPPLGRDTPALESEASCEVAVIGAGYTGLTAALSLVEEHGTEVTVLEAGTPGWGPRGATEDSAAWAAPSSATTSCGRATVSTRCAASSRCRWRPSSW